MRDGMARLLQRLAACWKAPGWRTKLERRVALTESLRALRYGNPSSPFVPSFAIRLRWRRYAVLYWPVWQSRGGEL